MSYFNINYLKEPNINKKVGYGLGIAALGDSIAKLGEIGEKRRAFDEEKAQNERENALEKDKFNFTKESANRELDIKIEQLRADKDLNNARIGLINAQNSEIAQKLRQQQEDRAANIALAKKLYPDETRGMSEAEILAWGNQKEAEHKARAAANKGAPKDMTEINAEQYNDLASYLPRQVRMLGDSKNPKYYASNFILGLSKDELDELKRAQEAIDNQLKAKNQARVQEEDEKRRQRRATHKQTWMDAQINMLD